MHYLIFHCITWYFSGTVILSGFVYLGKHFHGHIHFFWTIIIYVLKSYAKIHFLKVQSRQPNIWILLYIVPWKCTNQESYGENSDLRWSTLPLDWLWHVFWVLIRVIVIRVWAWGRNLLAIIPSLQSNTKQTYLDSKLSEGYYQQLECVK